MNDDTLDFLTAGEIALSKDFIQNGFVVCDVESPKILESISHEVIEIATNWLTQNQIESKSFELSQAHNFVSNEKLNDLRLTIFIGINKIANIRQRYFSLARQSLATSVGTKISMQIK